MLLAKKSTWPLFGLAQTLADSSSGSPKMSFLELVSVIVWGFLIGAKLPNFGRCANNMKLDHLKLIRQILYYMSGNLVLMALFGQFFTKPLITCLLCQVLI